VGVLTTNELARDSLAARLGAAALPARDALAMLERLLLQDLPGAALLDFSWSALQRLLPSASAQRFAELREQADQGDDEREQDLRRHLAELPPHEARELVLQHLCREVAGILRLPADKLNPSQSVFDLGMDSLMAVELGLALERRFGIRVPPMLLNENPSIERIAERLLATLAPQAEAQPADPTQQLVQGLLAQHAEHHAEATAAELAEQVREAADSGARLIA
jgi:acyl carrier protein